MKKQIVIYRRPTYRHTGVKKAAAALGVTTTAVALFLNGAVGALSKEKRQRIVIKDLPSLRSGVQGK